ncbi:hypothetical protein [Pseudoalteromonas denitrificans]|uniref:Uncharacterized protein n=1 Tax=Pseudoalteromonas denitrificans DSM 6059 TaxID=1123010 RepID=A0A1I1MD59_9GAMM|nr:hypothetical protein [Pseudoalteromonas denitrificans]SFC83294.1 hypothetical protein SAMN02745724_02668 [Pseudoalteromonas denitrificans DSM 6059]
MSALAKLYSDSEINERRIQQSKTALDDIWNLLTLAQKVALNKLNHFGYQLAFTRALDGTYLAIAICDGVTATIDFEGSVNLNPKVAIR